MDNSGTKKADVTRTYQGFDGYTPIASYIGNEGWKWNSRKQDKTAWVAEAKAAGAFQETGPGKRVALLPQEVERAWGKAKRAFRLVARVVKRTIDKKGQRLLVPDIELEGWWTTLTIDTTEVIEPYKHHGLTGELTPVPPPAKRRRIKTVLQEIMYRAAKFVAHARRLVLDFGRGVAAHVEVFAARTPIPTDRRGKPCAEH